MCKINFLYTFSCTDVWHMSSYPFLTVIHRFGHKSTGSSILQSINLFHVAILACFLVDLSSAKIIFLGKQYLHSHCYQTFRRIHVCRLFLNPRSSLLTDSSSITGFNNIFLPHPWKVYFIQCCFYNEFFQVDSERKVENSSKLADKYGGSDELRTYWFFVQSDRINSYCILTR